MAAFHYARQMASTPSVRRIPLLMAPHGKSQRSAVQRSEADDKQAPDACGQ